MPSSARLGIELLAHELDRLEQPGEALERVVLALERDDHARPQR